MSSSLMSTEPGGEQSQYEAAATENQPHKKSGGQMGQASSTEKPSRTDEAAQAREQRGEQTAENIRYGQTISEGGMGGMTEGMKGSAGEQGYGRVEGEDVGEGESAAAQRRAAGYGGERDVDREVGA